MAQPPPSRLSPRSLLALPFRLCNPPPAVAKVRSCTVTPVLDVRLDDVLARRHLPPIGLKDFEEYLLYVEHAPENLYFVLWLEDYTTRYHQWVQREKSALVPKQKSRAQRPKFAVPPTPDPTLAMFYLRAKQTFFTPNGEYELNIPSDVLAPFHATSHAPLQARSLWNSQSIHPDPAVFTEVAIEARTMLNESLKRFVRAAYTNVGSRRAICGIVAGCIITLGAGTLPLLLTAGGWNAGPHGRLIRLAAFPGLWFGLTVLIASLQGVCLMVYLFGDLRQLRKFELARPSISNPLPIPVSPPLPTRAQLPPLYIPPHPSKSRDATSIDSPTAFTPPVRPYTHASSPSFTLSSDSSISECCNEIDISPAFYDDVPAPEGPATATALHRPEFRLPAYIEPAHIPPERRSGANPVPITVERRLSVKHSDEFGPTAGFIPDNYLSMKSMRSLSDATTPSLQSERSACYFNFDLLPTSKGRQRLGSLSGIATATTARPISPDLTSPRPQTAPASGPVPRPSSPVVPSLGRTQYKCNPHAHSSEPAEKPISVSDRPCKLSLTTLIPSFTAGVPAFASPLTQVESPVVKRAQWEVVVKASIMAVVIAGTLTGIVVGVVP